MSSFDRRAALIAIAGGVLAGCGFQPVYRQDGGGAARFGRIILPEARDPESFAFRERALRRLGEAGAGADLRLDTTLSITEEAAAITQARDATRYRLAGEARYVLVRMADKLKVTEGVVRANAGYDAAAGAFATRSARVDARQRLAVELAELTAARLLAEAATE